MIFLDPVLDNRISLITCFETESNSWLAAWTDPLGKAVRVAEMDIVVSSKMTVGKLCHCRFNKSIGFT